MLHLISNQKNNIIPVSDHATFDMYTIAPQILCADL